MRAENLAKLLLTRQRDLEILTRARSQGADFNLLVRVHGAGDPNTPEFGVATQGITEPLTSKRWRTQLPRRLAKESSRVPTRLPEALPICLFVFDIDAEDGVYLWLNEPVEDRARETWTLVPFDPARLSVIGNGKIPYDPLAPLDQTALTRIVDKVVRWHNAQNRARMAHSA